MMPLIPCFNCGSQEIPDIIAGQDEGHALYRAECGYCHAHTAWCKTEDAACMAWNLEILETNSDPSITWNALTTAIEALDRLRGLMPEEYDRRLGIIQDLLSDVAWYAGDLQFEEAVIQETQEMKAWIREERGEDE